MRRKREHQYNHYQEEEENLRKLKQAPCNSQHLVSKAVGTPVISVNTLLQLQRIFLIIILLVLILETPDLGIHMEFYCPKAFIALCS